MLSTAYWRGFSAEHVQVPDSCPVRSPCGTCAGTALSTMHLSFLNCCSVSIYPQLSFVQCYVVHYIPYRRSARLICVGLLSASFQQYGDSNFSLEPPHFNAARVLSTRLDMHNAPRRWESMGRYGEARHPRPHIFHCPTAVSTIDSGLSRRVTFVVHSVRK
jgi:hypothetical protein